MIMSYNKITNPDAYSYFNTHAQGPMRLVLAAPGTLPSQSIQLLHMQVCVCVRLCVCEREREKERKRERGKERESVCACVRVCMCVYVYVCERMPQCALWRHEGVLRRFKLTILADTSDLNPLIHVFTYVSVCLDTRHHIHICMP